MTEKQIKAFKSLESKGLTPVLISTEKVGTDYSLETEKGLECGFQAKYTSKKVGILLGGIPAELSDDDFHRIAK
jgi:hypothetical protein